MACSTTTTTASSVQVNNFSNSLICPVMFTPLTDAVMLVPCGHTISEVAATSMYHGESDINGNKVVSTKETCPLCRRAVQLYCPNLAVRSLVESTLGINIEAALPSISTTIQDDKENDLDSIPFPGKGGKFILNGKNWKEVEAYSLIRKSKFVSQVNDSIFQQVKFLGYENGNVIIMVKFNKKYTSIALKYLSKCGIQVDYTDVGSCCYIEEKKSLKLLFHIIAKYNELPADSVTLLRDIVASDNWKTVAP